MATKGDDSERKKGKKGRMRLILGPPRPIEAYIDVLPDGTVVETPHEGNEAKKPAKVVTEEGNA